MPGEGGNIDPALRALGGRARYQLLQVLAICIGAFGAAYQLLDNIFIGREVMGHRCAPPDNVSALADQILPQGGSANGNVTYGECGITVSQGNQTADIQHPCLFGFQYDYRRDLSFRTEFDLVCDRELLGSLAQSFVILGQGFGAVISSIVSDRLGRKLTLVASQLGLMVLGLGIGLAPVYWLFALLKFLVGCCQQGVVSTTNTMSIELFPMEYRSMQALVTTLMWGCGACSMTLFAYVMRESPWRHLQFTLSGVSGFIFLVQLWYVDESLRWLLANGRKERALAVITRAANTNGCRLQHVFAQLQDGDSHELSADVSSGTTLLTTDEEDAHDAMTMNGVKNTDGVIAYNDVNTSDDVRGAEDVDMTSEGGPSDSMLEAVGKTLEEKRTVKLTILDIFRHWRLLSNALVVWVAWFTCAFSFFTLYMMSTTLVGNRFLNYFLMALMELPTGFLLYYLVDKMGRKFTGKLFFAIAGIGLVSSGILRIFDHISALATLSIVTAMLGMCGASTLFGFVFFITPELFPTNVRNQSVGVSSFAGRMGGMIAPFMTNLAKIAIWAPGAMIGSLCFLVVFLFRFLPETKGRELPHTIEDIKQWRKDDRAKREKKV